MKLTVFYDGQFWVGIIEIVEGNTFKAGKYLFGNEPNDTEILDFVNNKLLDFLATLFFGISVEDTKPPLKMNPKRLAREVAKGMKKNGVSTVAQEAMKHDLETRKKEKKISSRKMREEEKERKREIARKKAKAKHRGK